jgi:dihydropyrimidinase
MQMTDLVIANGTVVLPEGPRRADVLIRGETILDIVDPGTGRGETMVDATGKIVLPGGVDPHVHLMVGFMGQRSVYDFESGGIAALRGGTTTVVDFALQRRGGSMLAGLKHRRKQADPVVTLDYGLHLIATDVNAESLAELAQLRAEGVSSLKVYTVYEEDGLKLEDGALYALMQQAAKDDLMLVLHAENAGIVERLRAEAVAARHTHPRYHGLTRPPISEVEAISRAIHFSRDTGCGVHILHLVAGQGVGLIEEARRRGLPVTAETCTHFLALTNEAYERENAHNYIMSPPLRDGDNQLQLWQGLREGVLSAVTSDEVSYSAAAKALGLPSFANVANGCTGIEARLPVLFTLGVAEGRLSLERFTEVFSTWPARIFGLGDRKGQIAKGYDADLVVIDPESRRTMTPACDYGDIGYNVYEGMSLTGWAQTTIYRGQVTVKDGAFLGQKGQGRFLHRGAGDRPVLT